MENKPVNITMPQTIFNWLIVIAGSLLLYLSFRINVTDLAGVLGNIAGISLNLIIWFIVIFGIEFVQLGFKRNIKSEIYDNNNVAAAIYEVGIKLGAAWVIAKGLL